MSLEKRVKAEIHWTVQGLTDCESEGWSHQTGLVEGDVVDFDKSRVDLSL